jgi:hypothetical protein
VTAFAELSLEARTEQLEKAVAEIRKIGDAGDQAEKQVSKATGLMGVGFGKLAGIAAAALAPLASGALFVSATREAEKFQTSMFRMEAVIAATGGVAGRSADQLREQARAIAWSTLESTEGVLQAQRTLLTFRNVQGDVFDRTIKAAADMSAALGGDLNSATMQLAKALENPTEGLGALSRSGTVFTSAQKEMVKAMVEAGDMASAQAFILSELEAQYGGTAQAAAQGLAGAQDTLGQAIQEAKLAIADQLGLLELATSAANGLAGSIVFVTNNLDLFAGGIAVLGVAIAGSYVPAVYAAIAGTVSWTAALAAKTAGMSAAAIAAGVLSGAMRALGAAVALAGGPWGILAGLVAGAAAYLLFFKEKSDELPPTLDDVVKAQDTLNASLGVFRTGAAGSGAEAIAYAENLVTTARAAIAATEAVIAFNEARMEGMAPEALAAMQAQPGWESNPLRGMIEGQAKAREELEQNRRALKDAQRTLGGLLTEKGLAAATGSDVFKEIIDGVQSVTVSVEGLNDVLAFPAIGGKGGGAGDDGFVGRLQSLQEQFQTEREVIDAWYDESQAVLADRRAMELLGEEGHKNMLLQVEELYQQQLAALRGQSHQQTLSEAGTFFGAMAGLAQSGGERFVKIQRTMAAAQGLINAYLGATQVLADPKLGFFGKMAAYVSVLSAGLGLVSAIKGGGSGGAVSSGGGGSLPSSSENRQPSQAPAQQQRRIIRFDVQGDGMFADMLRENVAAIADAIIDEQRLGGTTILVGRA